MPSRRQRARRSPAHGSCGSSSRALLLCVFDRIRVLRAPLQADPLPLFRERLLRGRLEVLADDDELPAGIEVDDVARDHADVDDLPDRSGLAVSAIAHPDLLGPDRDAFPLTLDDVRDTDEARDELRLRMLVHLCRRA